MMVAGILVSCTKTPAETTSGETTDVIETTAPNTSTGESKESEATDDKTESSKKDDSATEGIGGDSESDASSDTEGTVTELGSGTESETESENYSQTETATDEPLLPSLIEGENAALIEYADRLANGVNAYFTDTKRTGYHFYNQNTSVTCDLQNTKVVTAISNKSGQNYIENTMDVFIRMQDGTEYYASDSTNNAIANIFRLGYYYYENRIEGQTFIDPYTFEDPEGKSINHTSINRYNMLDGTKENGVLKLTVTNNQDPWLSFGSINYRASDYNILALTMKVDTQFSTNFSIYMNAGSRSNADSTSFSSEQNMSFDIIADGEYHTYHIPIYYMPDYTGKVTGLRFDFMTVQGAMDAKIEISDMRLLNATINDGPTEVYLNRMFNTYSDKLHQTIQITTLREIEDVLAAGIVTEIPEEKVEKIVIRGRGGLQYSLEGSIAWNHVNYVGFDIKDAGIFGIILPYDGSGGKITVTLEDGVYRIEQTKSPTSYTLIPSPAGTNNGSDLYFGHRVYTDTTHTFDKFIAEAELEINPLTEENFVIDAKASTFGQFIGYDGLRGCYTINMDGEGGFGPAYKLHQNRQYNVTFNLKGDGVNDRKIYVLALVPNGGSLECAALLDGKQMMLPVPLEVGKNFGEGGDSPIFYKDDTRYSETILPLIAASDTDSTYSIVNLYYNWGKYPLKQISFIQYYAPYYHLSTGVHESNCIIPYYFTQWADTLNMLPDHRPMSGPVWDGDPQRTYCGVHSFLQYTDADGNYYASENVKDVIGSYGPIYADVTMDFVSDDGKIKVSYNHMEFPQTDENRAFYEMKYEIIEDVSFKNFAKDLSFYSVTSLDPKGHYTKVGYLDKNNESQVATAAVKGESFSYVLGDNCPYFSFFDMPNCGDPRGYNNLSFLIYRSSFTIGGKTATPNFVVNNTYPQLSLSLDLGEVTLKAGDSFTIYAIIMPWQYYDEYDEVEPDKNVRRVRENTLLNPLTVTADKDCEKIESVFLPKVKTTNGKSAEFTLTGGHNNVPVRIYGFEKLTVPVVEELVNEEWIPVDLSSFSTPDPFGYGYYYDGYGVYYDGDGTFSYSFITTMDNGAPRKFRVTAAEDFAGWPEIPEVKDPMNFWIDPQDLNAKFTQAAARFGEFSIMSEDGVNFIRVNRNGTTSEATLSLFDDAEGALAGRYLVFKFRAPQGSDSKIETLQFYTSTENVMYDESGSILIVGQDFNAHNPANSDGNWHVIIFDLEAYADRDCFKKADDGNYYVKYLRYDTFNPEYATNAIIDIAYIGFHDSLEHILDYNKNDLDYVSIFTGRTDYTNVDPKTGAEVEIAPPVIPPVDAPTDNPDAPAFNFIMNAETLNAKLDPFKSRFHSVTLSESKDYITLAGSTGNEATVEIIKDSEAEAGRYLVLKYRIPKADQPPFGYWQFYLNTDGNVAGSGNAYSSEGYGTAVISDGEWQVLIVDIAARMNTTYRRNSEGKYLAKFFRFDFFNSQFPADVTYDIEYIAFSDNLSALLASESDMEYVTYFTSQTGYKMLDPKTGNEIGGSGDDTTEETTSKPSGDVTETPDFNYMMNAETIEAKIASNKSKFHAVTLSESKDYITLAGSVGAEVAIEIVKGSKITAGRYMVIKYRIPKADQPPFGYWQFYINTDGSGAGNGNAYYCEGYGTMVISDGEWQVLIIDLEARNNATYAKNAEGKYVAQFFRFDFFNSQFSADVTYDLEYIAFSDNLDGILEHESDLDYVTLCTAQKESTKLDPKTGNEIK